MKLHALAPALLLAAACTPGTAVPPPAPPPPAAAAVEEATFTMRQGATPIVTERSRRTADHLEVEFTVPNGARVEYAARLRPDASVAFIEVRQFAPGAEPAAAPAMESTGTFEGDTVRLTRTRDGTTEALARGTVPGTVVFINPSPSLLEQIVRRARAMGGERAEVPVWSTSGGGQNYHATVEFTAPDAAVVTIADTQFLLETDARGRLLGGTVPAQALTIERAPAGQP